MAEVAASLLIKNGADSRISTMLRLNLDQFDAKAVGIMCALFGDSKAGTKSLTDERLLMTRLTQVTKLFESWAAFRGTLSPAAIEEIAYFDQRVQGLRRMVLEPGFDQCQLEDLLPKEDQEDSEICQELVVMFDELSWQFQELTRVLERKLADYGWSLPVSRRADFNLWMAQVQEFIAR